MNELRGKVAVVTGGSRGLGPGMNPGPMRLASAFAELAPGQVERAFGLFQTRAHFGRFARLRETGAGQ